MTVPPQRLLLLDTASLYFRAFYGVPDRFRAPDGTPVNAVRGLLDFIARLVSTYEPSHLVCCWDDDWRPGWRVDLVASYKAHRLADDDSGSVEEVPDLLTPQVPVIIDALAAFGIARVGVADHEADDVIGSYAAQSPIGTDVVTGDRDLFQVIDDERDVRVLYVARGVANHEIFTDTVVLEKYGVTAAQYADFATLRGDSSDGLPGVRGVGEKTAAKLLAGFGSLDGILAAARDGSAALAAGPRARLLEAEDYVRAADRVVRVVTDLELPPLTEAALPSAPVDPDGLAALVERWGIASSVNRLTAALSAVAGRP